MQNNSFLNNEELKAFGLKSFGNNVLISRYACFYNPACIEIGDNVRIDDFCILSGNIQIGNNIHISAYCAIYASAKVTIEDFAGLSPRTTIFSSSDDFSGDFLIGPMNNSQYRNVTSENVVVGKYSQVGAGSIIMPGVVIGQGVAVGAMSLVLKSLDEWGLYAGIPVKFLKERKKGLLRFV